MDSTNLIILAGAFFLVFVVIRYGKRFKVKFKGFGADVAVRAEGSGLAHAKEKVVVDSSRPVETSKTGGVSIGGSADNATVVTGNNNKIR